MRLPVRLAPALALSPLLALLAGPSAGDDGPPGELAPGRTAVLEKIDYAVDSIFISRTGQYALRANKAGGSCLVAGGKVGKVYDVVWDPIFHPDGKTVAFIGS